MSILKYFNQSCTSRESLFPQICGSTPSPIKKWKIYKISGSNCPNGYISDSELRLRKEKMEISQLDIIRTPRGTASYCMCSRGPGEITDAVIICTHIFTGDGRCGVRGCASPRRNIPRSRPRPRQRPVQRRGLPRSRPRRLPRSRPLRRLRSQSGRLR